MRPTTPTLKPAHHSLAPTAEQRATQHTGSYRPQMHRQSLQLCKMLRTDLPSTKVPHDGLPLQDCSVKKYLCPSSQATKQHRCCVVMLNISSPFPHCALHRLRVEMQQNAHNNFPPGTPLKLVNASRGWRLDGEPDEVMICLIFPAKEGMPKSTVVHKLVQSMHPQSISGIRREHMLDRIY